MGGNKKVAIASGSLILLVAVVAAISVIITHYKTSNDSPSGGEDRTARLQTSIKAIQTVCNLTDYPKACEKALTSVAGGTTDSKELMKLTFKVASDHIQQAMKHSSTLSAVVKDPMSAKALKDCRELFEDAIDDLKESLNKFDGFDISKAEDIIDDLRVWLSAVLTYQETCLDGFKNVSTDAGRSMGRALKSATELTTNVLSIVDEMSTFSDLLKIQGLSRRLLEVGENGEFPSWISTGTRRLLGQSPLKTRPHVVVAQDGSGDCRTIHEALAKVPKNRSDGDYFVIHIREGVYKEILLVPKKVNDIVMIGDGPKKTRISGKLNFIDGTTTFKSATVAVEGNGFIAKDIGFENTAGPEKHQAVALRVSGDRAVFYNCQMDGYQDTLYAHAKRQFYRDCSISGTIDFIFGDSAAVFQNCEMRVRKPMRNQQNIVTAQGRKQRRQPTGLVLHGCRIIADPELYPVRQQFRTYLGRPWKEYSRTIIMQSQIDDLIHPDGWMPWAGDFGLRTCFYAEIENTGLGAAMESRVKWKGIKKVNFAHATTYMAERFIQGSKWLRGTGVPYIPGLLPQGPAGKTQ